MLPNLETQIEFEQLYDKNQLIPRLRGEFIYNEEIINHCKTHQIPLKFACDLMVQMVIHKRVGVDVLIGILHHHFSEEENPYQTCADMILRSAKYNLIDCSEMNSTIIMKIDVSEDVYKDIATYQYPLPCLINPAEVETNRDIGYYTMKGSIILKGGNHHDDDVCLDHINRSNSIALSINTEVAEMVQNRWRDLDKPKQDEEIKDYQKRVEAFEKYDKNSRDVMQHLYLQDNKFYLTHKYDKRGRTYAQGYHVNTQGNPWNKAVIEFANKELPNDI